MTTFVHTHDFPEFFLVTRGIGFHLRNDVREPLSSGMLTWVNARDTHHYQARETGLTFYNLALAPAWWKSFGALAAIQPPPVLTPAMLTRPAWSQAASLLSELLDRPTPALLLETASSLWARLMEKDRIISKNSTHNGAPPPEWLAQLAGEWRRPELLREPIGFWQKRSGRSPEHFARSCRKYFGAPPTELLNRERIAQIKARLISGTDAKIVELALDAGFQNLGFFYRTFRRLEGCAPRVWLERRADFATVPH